MIFSKNITVDPNFNLESVYSAIKSMSKRLNRLSKMVEQLPDVKNDNQANDQSIENLYAEKEESYQEANRELKTLRGYGKQIEDYMATCSTKRNQISKDAQSLNISRAKEQYAFAELSLGLNIKKANQRQRELSDMISYAEKILKLARSKKFPGRAPKKRFIPPPDFLATLAGVKQIQPPTQAPAVSYSSELNSLMALGPIGRGFTGSGSSIKSV